jgi:hypothetical protein
METVWNKYVSRSVWFFLQKEKKIYNRWGCLHLFKGGCTRSPHMVGWLRGQEIGFPNPWHASHSHLTKVTLICIHAFRGCSFAVMVCAVDCRRLGTQPQQESPTLHTTTRSVEMGPRATIAIISGCQFGSLATLLLSHMSFEAKKKNPLLHCLTFKYTYNVVLYAFKKNYWVHNI